MSRVEPAIVTVPQMTAVAVTAPAPVVPPGRSLRAGVIGGSMWVLAEYGVAQVLRLAGNLVLSRLLFPEAFGLMSLVNVFMQGLEMFSDIGSRANIVQSKRGDDPAFLNTAWTLQIIRGATLSCLAMLLAWPAARLYDERLLALLPVSGLAAAIAGCNATALVTLSRRLHLRPLVCLNLTAQVSGIAVMIVWASLHRSVWALVIGGLVTSMVRMIGSHLLPVAWRNRLYWDASAARDLFHFGKWVFLTSVTNFLAAQGDRLLLGAYLSMSWLGVYGIAFFLSDSAGRLLSRISHSVLFPAFSQVARTNPARAWKVYYQARFWLDVIAFPAMGFLIVCAPLVVRTLYDARYAQAGWMLQILAIRIGASALAPASAFFLAQGKPVYAALAAFCKGAMIFGGIPLGWHLAGIHGVVWAVGLSDGAAALPLLIALQRHQVLRLLPEMRALGLLAGGLMAGWLLLRILG